MIPTALGAGWSPAKTSTADAVYARLREAIIGGQIAPGTRMREIELAERLGVSRTPLREALARLAGDRLLKRARGGGLEAIDWMTELQGICHIRMALEGYAARLAAERIDEAALAELERLVGASRRAPLGALEERARLNTEFHRLVFHACAVAPLIAQIESYAEYFIDARGLQRYGAEETDKAVREHAALLAALRRRDGEEAERILRRHLGEAFQTIVGS